LAALAPVAAFADDSCTVPDPITTVRCAVGGGVTSAVGGVVQFGAQQAELALTQWMVDAAVWLLRQLVNVIFSTSSPDLSAGWWRAHYADLVAVAWVVAPIFLLLGVVQAILRADLAVFGRILSQLLAVAVLTTGAVALAQMLIAVVDQLSSFVSRNSLSDLQTFLGGMAGTMAAATGTAAQGTIPAEAPPLAFLFLAGVLTAIAGVLIWLELLARTLVIYAALLFFPVLLAAAIWPKLQHLLRGLAEVLVAVIVSKFILVTIIVAGASAIAATGQQGQGPSLLIGAGLLLIAAWAPWKFYRLLPMMEAGAMHHFAAPFRGGLERWQSRGWRQARQAPRQWSAPRHGGGLKIAGQRPTAAGRPPAPAAGGRGPGGPTTVVGAAAWAAADAGAWAAAANRASGGIAHQRRQPGGPGAPAGWQSVSVATTRILVPGGADRAARRNGS
jgi:hypothetical protein